VAVSFIGGGNQSTLIKTQTCRKSLTNLSHNVVSCTPHHERDSNASVIGTDCTGSCKFKYHATMTARFITRNSQISVVKSWSYSFWQILLADFFNLFFRYQFYLQIKRDILQGRLPLTFEEAAELFAYAVQCKFWI
jgi:hypothetical protein